MDIRLLDKTTVGLRLDLDPGIVVPSGSLVQSNTNGQLFKIKNTLKNIGLVRGSIFGIGEALYSGDLEALANTITIIVRPITGWYSVKNDNDGSVSGDIDVYSGDLSLTSGIEELKQDIKIRLKFVQGEWFLDTTIGVPYFGSFLTKNPNLASIRAIIRQAIEGVPKVKSVSKIETTITTGSRELKINAEIKSDLNEILTFEDVLIF